MNTRELQEYKRLRRKGWTAVQAMRAARINVAFADAESRGLVKLSQECEYEPHDFSYIDTWELSPKRTENEKKRIQDLIDREGLWFFTANFRLNDKEQFEVVDSIGDCIGDIDDTGYDVDLKAAALAALDSAYQSEADQLAQRITYAGVV